MLQATMGPYFQLAENKGEPIFVNVTSVRGVASNSSVHICSQFIANRCRTALHEAAFQGTVEVVRLLLASGARPNLRNQQQEIALHYAVLSDTGPIIHLLVERGSDLGSMDHKGYTPLHKAAVQGCVGAYRYLRYWYAPTAKLLQGYSGVIQEVSQQYDNYRVTGRYDRHFALIRSCDPEKAQNIHLLYLLYQRSTTSLAMLPREMFVEIVKNLA